MPLNKLNTNTISIIKQPEGTQAKNKILNWLFLTDRQVSIEKLGKWLESATNGEYKIVRTVTR